MPEHSFLYLSRADVAAVNLDMPAIISLLEKAFLEKSRGVVQMPPKPSIHPQPGSFMTAMPAYIPSMQSAGIKWICGFPDNAARGLPYITGLVILNDDQSGLPYALMDCTWITAQRTGAKTAIAAKHLARPESSVAGILGCGVQGRTNLAALACVFPIQRVYAYDKNPEARARFIQEMRSRYPFEFIAVDEPKQAVVDSDLVVTAAPMVKYPTPIIESDWLKPGGFGSAVDYDSYWGGAAMAQMDRFITDDLPQFQAHRDIGYFQHTPEPYAELGELVAGLKPGRQSPEERTLAMNLGLAMDDMAVAPEIFRRAKEMKLGTWLSL